MNLKSKISIILSVSIVLFLTSCINLLLEDVENLNLVYGDKFTLISRTQIDSDLYCSIYSTEKLQKNVTVYVQGNWRHNTSYSNYDALKYEKESNGKLETFLKEELFLEDDEIKVAFDNKIYTTAYQSLDFDTLYEARTIWDESEGGTASLVMNKETVNISIKESAVTIRKDCYVRAIEDSYKKSRLASKMVVTFVDENGEEVDVYEFKNK